MSQVNNNTLINMNDTELLGEILQANVSERQKSFLLCYISACGHTTNAAMFAQVSRNSHYVWLRDETYQAAFSVAQKLADKELLNVAIGRAAHGVNEPVYYKGDIVGYITKYSDKLMDRLLQGAFPKKFGTKHIKTDNVDNVTDEELMTQYPRHALPDDDLDLLIAKGKQLKEDFEAGN